MNFLAKLIDQKDTHKLFKSSIYKGKRWNETWDGVKKRAKSKRASRKGNR